MLGIDSPSKNSPASPGAWINDTPKAVRKSLVSFFAVVAW